MDAGIIFGGVGAVAGVGALVYAHIAYRAGRASGTVAERANDLANGSNEIALDARKIALEANEYSHRAEKRETERHDVWWECGWRQRSRGIYQLIKRGDDEAHDIKVTVVVSGEEVSGTYDLIAEDGEPILCQFHGAANEFRRAQAARDEAKRLGAMNPYGGGMSPPPLSALNIKVRVEWTTSLGTPKVHDEEDRYIF
ncbi:hypothetical protein BH09ACT7_BH09ACT7_05100 [soil metagenome]